MYSIIAELAIKPENIDEAKELAKEMIENVKQEKGTLFYSLNIDSDDPNTFIFMERYSDKEALKVHGETPHFKTFMEKITPFLSSPPMVKILKEIDSI